MSPPSAWVVLKFGGTSVAMLPNWTNIAGIIAQRRAAALSAAGRAGTPDEVGVVGALLPGPDGAFITDGARAVLAAAHA